MLECFKFSLACDESQVETALSCSLAVIKLCYYLIIHSNSTKLLLCCLSLGIFYLLSIYNAYCRKPLREFLETIEEVTCEDIASVARKLISSPLTLASYGDGNSPSLS